MNQALVYREKYARQQSYHLEKDNRLENESVKVRTYPLRGQLTVSRIAEQGGRPLTP
jgi:hypothetical protein